MDENTIVIPAKKRSGLSRALDRVFHFTERGSSLGSEIGAGAGTFFIAVCALVMNTQIIGEAYGNYAGAYLAVTLISLAGTLLLGLVCNLPLAQTANMGLSAVLISMLGTDTGLTYANLMAVTFVAAAVYLLVTLSPLKKALVDALPVFGTGTVLLPWALVTFLSGDWKLALGLLALYGLVSLVRSLLEPKLVGDKVGLPPLAALFAMYLGFKALGVPGMILAPLAAIFVKRLHDSGVIKLWR